MRARLTSSHFVGRVGELAELELALRESASQRPVLVLLGGESGVGKTRLITEFERRLTDGARALRGDAIEQSEGELPYAPLLNALRPLVREHHPALTSLSSGSRAQLGALLPGLDDGGGTPRDRQDPSAQLRLFEALLELLDLLSEAAPLVLILEDMHWADRSTRTFVAFLARSLRQERVLLLLSYRTDELHRRHALRPLLAELERLDRARRIELEAFDRDELTEALSDILGAAPSAELVERLFARSEGNPLYTEELLAAGLDGRGAAPQSLRDAFILRIERLSKPTQQAARTIAVGRRLDEGVLEELTGIEPDALVTALREAVAEQVLITGEDGGFLFRHALLREAVYDDLLPGERGELHLALARLYESRPVEDDQRDVARTTTIASHYAAAGDQPAALRAMVRAALAATEVRAYGEASHLAERALELWPRVPPTARTDEIDHVGLLSLAASAHMIGGDRARGEVLLQNALGELDPEADARRYAGVLARLARVQWSMNRGLQGVETAQRALSMLPSNDTEERASLLAWLARTRFLRGRFRDALRDGHEALAAAVAAEDRCAEGEVLNTLGMTQVALGHVEEGIAALRKAIAIARETEDLDSYAYANLADMLNMVGRGREALEVAREGLAEIPRRASQSHDWMLLTVSELEFAIGEWEASWAHLGPPPEQLLGLLLMFRLLREAELALGVGDEELAGRCLEQVEPLVESSSEPQWIGSMGTLLGELRRRRRDLPGARAAVAHALDRIEVCTDDVMRIARISAVGAAVEADFAQRARDLREKPEEREAVTRARIHAQRLRAAAQEGGPVERAWSQVGAAELTRARGRSDPKLWAKAALEWEAMGRPYPAALCRWREAEAHVEADDREAAAQAVRAALDTARRLGARWFEAELGALRDRARLNLSTGADEEPAAATGEGNGAQPDPFGLTPRERQVLALIAEGATNRQIGAALYMAEKTASVHVSRILSKLGVRSRTQAAAVAHRMHLDS